MYSSLTNLLWQNYCQEPKFKYIGKIHFVGWLNQDSYMLATNTSKQRIFKFATFSHVLKLFKITHLLDGMISISTLKILWIIFRWDERIQPAYTNTWRGTQWCHSSRALHKRGLGRSWRSTQPLTHRPTPARSFCKCAGTDRTWCGECVTKVTLSSSTFYAFLPMATCLYASAHNKSSHS